MIKSLKYILNFLGYMQIILSNNDKNDKLLMILLITILLITRYYLAYGIQSLTRFYMFAKTRGKRITTDKNSTPEQLLREDEWDNAFSFGTFGLGFLFTFTNYMTNLFGEHIDLYTIIKVLLSSFILHITLIELVYYIFHVSLHKVKTMWKYMHSYHHKSIHTEPLTGNIQNDLEHLFYTINFAPGILAPVLFGITKSVPWWMIIVYTLIFDICNTIGHLNVEIFPKWWINTPLKYIFYTPTFHSLHHTRFLCNYSLFIPLYDLLFGTYSKKYDETFNKAIDMHNENHCVDVVFLSNRSPNIMNADIPAISNKSRMYEFTFRISSLLLYPYTNIIMPLFATMFDDYVLLHNYIYKSKYNQKQLSCEIWSSKAPFDSFLQKKKINDDNNKLSQAELNIVKACLDASNIGVKVLGLGWLAKAEWILNGGSLLLNYIPKNNKTWFVHGNTLTAGVVIEKILNYSNDVEEIKEIYIIGSTSKIGRALTLYLAQKEINIIMYTTDKNRFEYIYNEVPDKYKKYVKMSNDLNDGKKYKIWCVGKYIKLENILPHNICTLFDFTVPNVYVPPKFINVTYINAGHVELDTSLTDINYGFSNKYTNMFCCQAGSIVHMLEGWDYHELGPIDINLIDDVVLAAKKHGFKF